MPTRTLKTLCLASVVAACAGAAAAQSPSAPDLSARIPSVIPKVEEEVARGMRLFDIPGVAVGIISGDKLVYGKGFGVRSKGGKEPVDTKTVFQIGSATKAFLAATLAISVDKGAFQWDSRVVDLEPTFQLKDPWTTREFRVFDLIAQRSSLPPYVNDVLTALGYDEPQIVRSLRYAEPISSFRSAFSYTNVTHLLAGRMVARQRGVADWNALVAKDILGPLGMKDTSWTAETISAAPNHAMGNRWTPKGSVEIPFDSSFPYLLGPAGNLNSNVEDASRWLRLQLGNGTFEGNRIVSPENLAATRVARVGVTDTMSYAQGWALTQTPHGRVIWHNGGTSGFGTHMGFLPDYGVGVVVLSSLENQGFADALAMTLYDTLIGNPPTDHVKIAFDRAQANAASTDKRFTRPANAAASPDLAGLAGTYGSDMFGDTLVERKDDGLLLTLKDTGAKLTLQPFDGSIFLVHLVGEGKFAPVAAMGGDAPLGFMDFQADANGKLATMTWLYDDTQSYPFKRK
ncbi:serine hydrolase [Aquabacter sp. CN5-332]|uniref:serine hydrolase n=1 Tax=Aquabacter sp. CN5-332 TaxID=3156608 RepID=UPI0032B5FFE8